jgi:hypothetical protein
MCKSLSRMVQTELQDYFRDTCVTSFLAKRRPIETIAPGTAVIYPIALPDRLELLVSISDEQHQFTVRIQKGACATKSSASASCSRSARPTSTCCRPGS